MDAQFLARLFGYDLMAINLNLEGLSHADSLIRPAPDGNSINWVLGHIVTSRNLIFELLGETLSFLQFHEAYHTGQLGLQRRLIGKPGAIA